MNRRGFLTALGVAAGGVFVPKFGRWFRQGSGILVRREPVIYLRKLMGPVEMTEEAILKVAADQSAFIDYMERALPELAGRLRDEIDRKLEVEQGMAKLGRLFGNADRFRLVNVIA